MKLTVKYKMLTDISHPQIIDKGEWIDLRAAKSVSMSGPQVARAKKDSERKVSFSTTLLPLGVAMELPKGFEAAINPRSSTFLNYHVILGNSQGIIDNPYNGDNDEWKANLIAFSDVQINKGDRVLQFRIQPSQKATMWQKLRWLFSNGIKLVEVDKLGNPNRGGHGTTGIK
jgi:dUTP pyrophosphatase